MTSQDWSGRPPGGTEPNVNIYGSSNHMMPDGSGYLQAMTMDDISNMQHSYSVNSTALIDWMINRATNTLSNKAKPFNRIETVREQEIFVVTQAEIDAMVLNIPTPKAKQNTHTDGIIADANHQWCYN